MGVREICERPLARSACSRRQWRPPRDLPGRKGGWLCVRSAFRFLLRPLRPLRRVGLRVRLGVGRLCGFGPRCGRRPVPGRVGRAGRRDSGRVLRDGRRPSRGDGRLGDGSAWLLAERRGPTATGVCFARLAGHMPIADRHAPCDGRCGEGRSFAGAQRLAKSGPIGIASVERQEGADCETLARSDRILLPRAPRTIDRVRTLRGNRLQEGRPSEQGACRSAIGMWPAAGRKAHDGRGRPPSRSGL